ncbi:hypothetical protein H4W79_001066 [Nocardiopsis terrae]|uniref:Uncharacterized protein n=1 Tax=Nocardiopsis terrae TaxID=372655 RepID=A0ABR9HCV0_9ACTN|nr:hypothetical protein [Nocardiopsis terrae]MBE1456852.1 hypothetical protein [Nocardiopsis terrae]
MSSGTGGSGAIPERLGADAEPTVPGVRSPPLRDGLLPAARALVGYALDQGVPDNVTALLLPVGPRGPVGPTGRETPCRTGFRSPDG